MSKAAKQRKDRETRVARAKFHAALEAKGHNCKDRWAEFSGPTLPTAEEAKDLCQSCPLLGYECHDYKETGEIVYGVLDGEVIDKYPDVDDDLNTTKGDSDDDEE